MQGNPQLFAAVRASSVPTQRRDKPAPARTTAPATDALTEEATATRRRASVPSTLMAMMVAARRPTSG